MPRKTGQPSIGDSTMNKTDVILEHILGEEIVMTEDESPETND